ARIPLDYFKKPNRIERVKLILTVVALLGCGLWVAWGFVSADANTRYSRGPVVTSHASFENDCQSCHVSFSPMSESNWLMQHPSAADGKCQVCHSSDPKVKGTNKPAYDHHQNIDSASLTSCAGCHRDHQGREFALNKLPDSTCAACHRDLKSHVKKGE